MFLLMATSAGVGADTTAITAGSLTLMAVFAVLVVIAIVWGMRQKRIRANAAAQSEARAEEAGQHPNTDSVTGEPIEDAADAQADEERATERVGERSQAPAAAPAPAPAPAPAAPAAQGRYALTDVKGLGPRAVSQLAALGVGDLGALAALHAARAAEIDGQLGALGGRLSRDRWVEQARLLDKGDKAGFEAVFGKL